MDESMTFDELAPFERTAVERVSKWYHFWRKRMIGVDDTTIAVLMLATLIDLEVD
jgi:hypothetical protein